MAARSRYATNTGAVFSLTDHLVWCPTYRRPVVVAPSDARLTTRIAETAAADRLTVQSTVQSMDVRPDHVPRVIERDPPRAVAELVNRLTGRTSRVLRQEVAALRSRRPTRWSQRSDAGSVGAVSEASKAVGRRDIAAQTGV
jgi:putative transposase